MCVCWTRPANGCTHNISKFPFGEFRICPGGCGPIRARLWGNIVQTPTAAQERLGLLDILYREHYSTGLIRLKTLAGGGAVHQWPTKTKRAIFLHFSGWGDGIFSKLKTNNCAGDSSISSHIVYHPISQWQNLMSPTKKKCLHTRLLSIVNFLINLELVGERRSHIIQRNDLKR